MEPTKKQNNIAIESDQAETKRLKDEVKSEHEMYLRALADFDNYKRRVERERASSARSGTREIILSLLDVLDGFDRALAQMTDAPAFFCCPRAFNPYSASFLLCLKRKALLRLKARARCLIPSCTKRSARWRAASMNRAR